MTLLLASIVFFAATMQTISGFGFALTIMPLMTLALGFQTAAPLVALIGLTLYGLNLLRLRPAINKGEVLRLGIASAAGVPVGVLVLSAIEESAVKLLLGLILIAYAGYALIRPALPRVRGRFWAYPAGFVAGCLGGAYNVPGPPAIIYGTLQQWSKDEFRAVLQALFFLNATMVVMTHFATNHLTAEIFSLYLKLVPALLLGILAGGWLDARLSYARFQTIVALMLLGIGASLALTR